MVIKQRNLLNNEEFDFLLKPLLLYIHRFLHWWSSEWSYVDVDLLPLHCDVEVIVPSWLNVLWLVIGGAVQYNQPQLLSEWPLWQTSPGGRRHLRASTLPIYLCFIEKAPPEWIIEPLFSQQTDNGGWSGPLWQTTALPWTRETNTRPIGWYMTLMHRLTGALNRKEGLFRLSTGCRIHDSQVPHCLAPETTLIALHLYKGFL